ncbi:hypothetical protein C8F01DRAFT_1229591 [Mycena amicta]|nr:hypothetical protein C8F01DRAFT_1229591 [Mycena amicta]
MHGFSLPRGLAALTLTLLSSPVVRAGLTNLTIDDTDTTYFSFSNGSTNPPAWAAITPQTPCNYCSAQPQTKDIHNQTWHDGSVGSVGSFTFNGTAVWIYGIDLADPANISFTLPDVHLSTFHYYNGSEQFVFNSLLFSATNLPTDAGSHTVSWVVNKSSKNGTTALFDYAVITVDEEDPASTSPSESGSASVAHSSKSHAGPIAGGVIGGVLVLLLLGALVLFCWRRRRGNASSQNPQTPQSEMIQPFVEGHGGSTAPTLASRAMSLGSDSDHPPTQTESVGISRASISVAVPSSGHGKTLDTRWTSTSPPSTIYSASAAASSPTSYTPSALPSSIDAELDLERRTLAPTVVASSSAREQFLEDRLAALEAHVRVLNEVPPAGV